MTDDRNKVKKAVFFWAAAAMLTIIILRTPVCLADTPDTTLTVDVTLNGITANIADYTLEDLDSMPQTRQVYSSVTAYDAPSMFEAEGITLNDLLDKLGVKAEDVSEIVMSSSDGGLLKCSGEDYIQSPRYCYPGIFDGKEDKCQIPPMLALKKYEMKQAGEPVWSMLTTADGISFCFGQNEISDKVSIQYGKYINKITLVLNSGTTFVPPPKPFGSGSINTGTEDTETESAVQKPVEEEGLTVDSLTITVGYYGGPYQVKKVFTLDELYDMGTLEQAYTYIDNMPAVVLESAKGIRLTEILKAAGVDINSVESLHFYCSDVKNSWYQSINKEYLIDTIRYYYPKLQESWDYDLGEAGQGAADDAVNVETIIALEDNWLRFATKPDFGHLTEKSRFRLVFGQTDTTTRNAYRSARWIHTIEVMLGGKPPEDTVKKTKPAPEVGSKYRHDNTLGKASGDNSAGVQNWRVYEMSKDALELQMPEMKNPLLWVIGICAAVIFISGLFLEVIRFYREV